jgi:hypothetical protein
MGVAVNVPIYLKDAAGAAVTGATLTITVATDGGAFGAKAGTITEVGAGWYDYGITAAERGTAYCALNITAPLAVPVMLTVASEAATMATAMPASVAAIIPAPVNPTVTVNPPAFAGTVEFTGTVAAPDVGAVTLAPGHGLATSLEVADLAHVDAAQSLTATNTAIAAVAEQVAARLGAESGDTPVGYTRITQETLGTDGEALGVALPGSVLDAFAVADEAESAPIDDPVTVAANGTYGYDVPDGATYTVRFKLPNKHTVRKVVAV